MPTRLYPDAEQSDMHNPARGRMRSGDGSCLERPRAFQISGFTSAGVATTKPSTFIFATEDGTIVGWSNAGVNPAGFNPTAPFVGNYGIIAVDNSGNPSTNTGAVYKGLAIATDSTDSIVCSGKTLLYATNFRAGSVEIYDTAVITHPSAAV